MLNILKDFFFFRSLILLHQNFFFWHKWFFLFRNSIRSSSYLCSSMLTCDLHTNYHRKGILLRVCKVATLYYASLWVLKNKKLVEKDGKEVGLNPCFRNISSHSSRILNNLLELRLHLPIYLRKSPMNRFKRK